MILSNPARMQKRLQTIAGFTEIPGQITRRTYSNAWVDALRYLKNEMETAGMTVRLDSFGNLIGRLEAPESRQKPVAFGSHIDTVVNGGAYDGVAGIVAGMELVSMLHESGKAPKATVEVIATADEEGIICQKGYFGARFMTGDMPLEEVRSYKNPEGKSVEELRRECGLFENVPLGRDIGWAKNYYSRYIEVHVEQGGRLDKSGTAVGIVKGVVGIGRLFFRVVGEANHAGSTAMDERKDALAAAADLILFARKLGQRYAPDAVVTVGRLTHTPNLHNVISGQAALIIDYRSTDDSTSAAVRDALLQHAKEIQSSFGVEISCTKEIYTPVCLFSEPLLNDLRTLPYKNVTEMFSWAGHDAKAFVKVADTAMLFIPSKGGISHSSREYTDISFFEQVCNQLIRLI